VTANGSSYLSFSDENSNSPEYYYSSPLRLNVGGKDYCSGCSKKSLVNFEHGSTVA
jgi:hypothetical protein